MENTTVAVEYKTIYRYWRQALETAVFVWLSLTLRDSDFQPINMMIPKAYGHIQENDSHVHVSYVQQISNLSFWRYFNAEYIYKPSMKYASTLL